jgi:all-trans-retinol 13,14-reductase
MADEAPAAGAAKRAVVIGSGLSGLTCAVLLAEHGWKVTVLEAHAVPGGLMQRFRRGPFWFDTGFHFITGSEPDGIFRRIARRLGILGRMEFLPLDESAQYRIHIPGEAPFDFPVGIDASAAAVARRWPEQAEATGAFFAQLKGAMAATQWLDQLVPGAQPIEAGMHDAVAAILDRCGVTGRPKQVIGCLASILAMRPEACPLDLYAGFAGTALCGSWRAEGGGEAMVRPLVERFAELGGRLALRRAAERIVWTERMAESVIDAKGETHPCELCISTCHPAETLRLTGSDGFRPSLAERIEATPDSDSAVLVYAALDREPTGLGRSHHFARLGDRDRDDAGDLYYLAPSNFHETVEERRAHPYLEAMLWVPTASVAAWRDSRRGARPPEYEAWKSERVREILETVYTLHPEIRGTVVRTWASTPLSVQHYTRSRNGAAMGLSHDLGWLGSEPMPRRNRLRNLCFAGQSVGHPGVVGTMIGAFILCESILGRDLRAEVFAGAAAR